MSLTAYKKNGYTFTQIKRKGDLGMYLSDKHEIYEIVHIQIHPERRIGGNVLRSGEFPPSTSSWGQKGFTAISRQNANAIFCRELSKVGEGKP